VQADQQTAAAIPELDLIIGGHSHTFLYSPRDRTPITDISITGVNGEQQP
jgi:2',3'-cyclic-nucleotide 2'-phosphodiesterase (5'-nucleotidase family)